MKHLILFPLVLSITFFSVNANGQVGIQTGAVSLEIKTIDVNNIAINGVTKDAQVVIDANQNLSTLTFDPTTIKSDNLEFDEALQEAEYAPFIVEMVLDPFELNAISVSKTPATITCVAIINGIVEKLPIQLTSNMQVGSNSQSYLITGTGLISLNLFGLKEKLPMLKEDIQFRLTQNITVSAR